MKDDTFAFQILMKIIKCFLQINSQGLTIFLANASIPYHQQNFFFFFEKKYENSLTHSAPCISKRWY